MRKVKEMIRTYKEKRNLTEQKKADKRENIGIL